LHIVDFGDFRGLPRALSAGLRLWLRKFHVEPRTQLFTDLERSEAVRGSNLRIYPGRYAFCWRGAQAPEGVLANVAGQPQAAEIS